jgi:hypothetical protein
MIGNSPELDYPVVNGQKKPIWTALQIENAQVIKP